MIYLQLFKLDLTNQLTEYLGSDGVIPMDGRWSVGHIHDVVRETKLREDVMAYQVRKSPDNRYSNSHPLSSIITVR
jgi:hypothetical protein